MSADESAAPHVTHIHPRATPAEVAAITAAIAVADRARRAAAASAVERRAERLDAWVAASRRSAQRANMQRGPWRLSGRLGRRSRT